MLLYQEYNVAKHSRMMYVCFKVGDVGINLNFWYKTCQSIRLDFCDCNDL
jgi:hypothetical protein